jgi:hypothetical protein
MTVLCLVAPPARAALLAESRLDEAAESHWPLLDPAAEAELIRNRAHLGAAARRAWAVDRALPMLAGELAASDEILREVLAEVAGAAGPSSGSARPSDLLAVQQARAAYAARDLKTAATRYASVAQSSPLWPDALRERAWTLLLLGREGDALGATVSLKAPYFPAEDQAEGRLMKATIFLQRCRFDEARAEVASLADAPLPTLTDDIARTALAANMAPSLAGGEAAWNAPLVQRVRAALAQIRGRPPTDSSVERISNLGVRLLRQAFDAEADARRDARERALKIRYESLKLQRQLLERGATTLAPSPAALPDLNDDEIGWTFDGVFWRDELGTYRYTAGDACPRGTAP